MTGINIKNEAIDLPPEDLDRLKKLERILEYSFKNKTLLVTALMHRSYVAEKKIPGVTDNQRMEWLGDSVLGLVVTEYLYDHLPESDEGLLSKFKSQLVSQTALARMAKSVKLSEYLFVGKGEEETGGRSRESTLSDALESVVGAIYLDKGFVPAKAFILKFHESEMTRVITMKQMKDYKSILQEYLQKRGSPAPMYDVLTQTGPDHKKVFTVRIWINGAEFRGTATSKKEAEQMAAWVALDSLE